MKKTNYENKLIAKFLSQAFNTIMNNVVKFTTLNSAGDFILFLGKCIVTLATSVIAVIYFQHDENLHFYAVPVFFVAIFSFFIAHAVISLYEVSRILYNNLYLFSCEDQLKYKKPVKN